MPAIVSSTGGHQTGQRGVKLILANPDAGHRMRNTECGTPDAEHRMRNTECGTAMESSLMNKDDNSPYHHGNLRAELLKTAAQQLQLVGVEKLSIRAVSRALGVSQSAPYRHFKNKNELLAALVKKGFSQLAQCQRRAKEGLTPTEALSAMGVAYVNFACAHPELFKLMFSSQSYCEQNDDPSEPKGEAFSGGEAFNELMATVEEGIQQGYFQERPSQEVAFAAWSIVHGLAYLTIDYSRIGIPDDATHHLVQSALDVFMRGVSAEGK